MQHLSAIMLTFPNSKMVTNLFGTKSIGGKFVKEKTVKKEKNSMLVILLSIFLLTNMLPYGIIKCNYSNDNVLSDNKNRDENICHYMIGDLVSPAVSNPIELSESNNSRLSIESFQSSDISGLFINEFMADNSITVAGPNGNS